MVLGETRLECGLNFFEIASGQAWADRQLRRSARFRGHRGHAKLPKSSRLQGISTKDPRDCLPKQLSRLAIHSVKVARARPSSQTHDPRSRQGRPSRFSRTTGRPCRPLRARPFGRANRCDHEHRPRNRPASHPALGAWSQRAMTFSANALKNGLAHRANLVVVGSLANPSAWAESSAMLITNRDRSF